MNIINYFSKTFSTLRNHRTKENNPPPKNELIHPSFGVTSTDAASEKKNSDSLLFLMYSKENETLFI
jgi:hypothetical protein